MLEMSAFKKGPDHREVPIWRLSVQEPSGNVSLDCCKCSVYCSSFQLVQMRQSRQHHLLAGLLNLACKEYLV